MLRSGGLIAIVEQPRGPATEAAVRWKAARDFWPEMYEGMAEAFED